MKKAIIPILYALVFSFGNVLAGNKPLPKDINSIINQLTLEQKARLLVGCTGSDNGLSHMVAGSAGYTFPIDSLGIPSINLADGPVGVRSPLFHRIGNTSYMILWASPLQTRQKTR